MIFVTPKVGTFKPDIGELLRHELSHAVLKQGLPLLSDLRMNTQPWATEGVAGLVARLEETAPGRQPIYLAKAEFLTRAKSEELWPSFAADAVKDWRFSYTAWIYFWNRQIERSGKDTFLRFQRACFAQPRACRETFGAVYGTTLRSAVDELQLEVRAEQVVGREQTVF